jgi:hypothetical protein
MISNRRFPPAYLLKTLCNVSFACAMAIARRGRIRDGVQHNEVVNRAQGCSTDHTRYPIITRPPIQPIFRTTPGREAGAPHL